MSELVMNADGQLGHASGSPISGGAFVITSSPSTVLDAPDTRGVFRGPLQYTFAGGNASGFDSGSIATTAPQTINPTAIASKSEVLALMREGDSGTMNAQGTVGGTPTAIAGPVEVAIAGQTKVKAE